MVVTGARGLTVYGSDSQLATAVANLVENAIAYSAEDTTVTLGPCAQDGDWSRSPSPTRASASRRSDLDRIFERFYRADQARSRATGGTGLGLAIVKHIATNHGGRVDVDQHARRGLDVHPAAAGPPAGGRAAATDLG